MKIGIDLDGVVADTVTPFLKFYNKKYGTLFVYKDIISHDFWDLFGITREVGMERMHDFYEQTKFDIVPVDKAAIGAIKKLGENHKLVVITSRPLMYQEKTLKWLEKHFSGVFDKVVFTNQYSKDHVSKQTTKSAVCEQEKIDLFIEDFDKYANECSPFCKKVLLFDQPWNKNAELPKNGVRVKNWEEVLSAADRVSF